MKKLLALLLLSVLPQVATADSFDLRGVTFKPGHPTKDEQLTSAVVDADELVGLKRSATALRKFPLLRLEIAGHVDQYECQSLDECQNLGLRRAVVIYRELLDLGVDPKQIIALREFGSARPIASNSSESWLNSRTELNIYSDP